MSWKLVYANATRSKKLVGTLDALFDAIDKGVNFRVGLEAWEGSNMVSLRWNTESVRYNRQRTMAFAAFPVYASNLNYSEDGVLTMATSDKTHKAPVCVVRSDGVEHMFDSGEQYFVSDPARDDRQYLWFADL